MSKVPYDPHCKDYGKDCYIDLKDYFMVTNEVWDKYGIGRGLLCMGCMEKRIGRPLIKEDILPCPLTLLFNPYTKKLLKTKQS